MVVSAESVRDFYIRQVHADPAKVDVIYNAVDFAQLQPTTSREPTMRASLGVPADAPVAGIIARLTEQKGHRYLFDAMAVDAGAGAAAPARVGDGDLRDDARAAGRRARVCRRACTFSGARRDLGDLLAAMDVFVMPSLWEGLPLSMVLAMGAGLPVVATARRRHSGSRRRRRDRPAGAAGRRAGARRRARAAGRRPGAATRDSARRARAFVLPRFGVDGYVDAIVALYDRLLAGERIAA